MVELKPIRWKVIDREPLRQLLWFCNDPTQQIWVEPMGVEKLDNAADIMTKALNTISDHCGIAGEIKFGDDPTVYHLRRVELRTRNEIEKTISFHPSLVQMNPHILVKIITKPAHPRSGSHDVPEHTHERRFERAINLAQATRWAKDLAEEAALNAGIVRIDDDLIHLLDRVEVYYDDVFQRVFPLDYGNLSLGGE